VPRLLVQGGTAPIEVFDVVGVAKDVIQVRSAFLFELGEELSVQIEQDGSVSEAIARVRAHLGSADTRTTELEISERSEPRRLASR
jgi:hypothetical protein